MTRFRKLLSDFWWFTWNIAGTSTPTYIVSSPLVQTSSTTVSSPSTLPTSAVCLDKDNSCSVYGRDLLCLDRTYQDYAKENCALYCGFCGGIFMYFSCYFSYYCSLYYRSVAFVRLENWLFYKYSTLNFLKIVSL